MLLDLMNAYEESISEECRTLRNMLHSSSTEVNLFDYLEQRSCKNDNQYRQCGGYNLHFSKRFYVNPDRYIIDFGSRYCLFWDCCNFTCEHNANAELAIFDKLVSNKK